jgi:hypothetical protein
MQSSATLGEQDQAYSVYGDKIVSIPAIDRVHIIVGMPKVRVCVCFGLVPRHASHQDAAPSRRTAST